MKSDVEMTEWSQSFDSVGVKLTLVGSPAFIKMATP